MCVIFTILLLNRKFNLTELANETLRKESTITSSTKRYMRKKLDVFIKKEEVFSVAHVLNERNESMENISIVLLEQKTPSDMVKHCHK